MEASIKTQGRFENSTSAIRAREKSNPNLDTLCCDQCSTKLPPRCLIIAPKTRVTIAHIAPYDSYLGAVAQALEVA